MSRCISFAMASLFAFLCASRAQGVTIAWRNVGNVANPADPLSGYGSVGYSYAIGEYEVTNSQYAEFLNAKAASDPLALYNTGMSTAQGGINRSGSSGSFSYSVNSGYENMPAAFVNWYDAIRFANWMNNGQGNADTESGAYTLLGGTPAPSNANSITRNLGSKIVLPSENEWYKAAYYDPTKGGSDYWLYPTRSDAAPTSQPPPGGSNGANYLDQTTGYAVTGSTISAPNQNYRTSVGAYVNSASFYGTFDQGGNLGEWNERLLADERGDRGGSWSDDSGLERADIENSASPTLEYNTGFRLASIPEPSSLSLVAFAFGVPALRRRRGASAFGLF